MTIDMQIVNITYKQAFYFRHFYADLISSPFAQQKKERGSDELGSEKGSRLSERLRLHKKRDYLTVSY